MSSPAASNHTMRVTLDHDTVSLTPLCHESDGAPCRVMCVFPDCEPGGPDHDHDLKPVDYCAIVNFMMESGTIAEDFCSDKYYDDREVPLYDGMSITTRWNGDYYEWDVVGAVVEDGATDRTVPV